jgi:hypothetical protein
MSREHADALFVGPDGFFWTGGAFEASRRLSCRRMRRRTTASRLAWARASSHAPARATKSQLAWDARLAARLMRGTTVYSSDADNVARGLSILTGCMVDGAPLLCERLPSIYACCFARSG